MTGMGEFRTAPKDALLVHIREPRHGYQICIVEQGEFPVKALFLKRWLDLYRVLRPTLFGPGVRVITGLQMWHIHHDDGASVLSKSGAAWEPDFGVGVWLDQPPPRLWSPEEFEMLGPGDTLRPPILSAIRLKALRLDHHAVWASMGGRGSYLEFSIDGEVETYLEEQADLYRQWIQEELIRVHPFFLPLVSSGSFESELFAQRLFHFDAVNTYVRESQEDRGLLVVSKEKLEHKLAAVADLIPCASPGHGITSFVVKQIKT